jgi:bifunctional non-homologous end joining protein LigD
MPDETVVDGEVVALDPEGRPSFNLLQNYGSARAPLHFFVFDVLILKGEDVMGEPLVKRRQLLEKHVLPKLDEPIRCSPILEGRLKDLIDSVEAARADSEPLPQQVRAFGPSVKLPARAPQK